MKFESFEYRDELAKKIKGSRKEDIVGKDQEILEEEREKIIYKVSKLIQDLRRGLSPEMRVHLEEFKKQNEDSQELQDLYIIIDISEALTQRHRLMIEAEAIEDIYYASD